VAVWNAAALSRLLRAFVRGERFGTRRHPSCMARDRIVVGEAVLTSVGDLPPKSPGLRWWTAVVETLLEKADDDGGPRRLTRFSTEKDHDRRRGELAAAAMFLAAPNAARKTRTRWELRFALRETSRQAQVRATSRRLPR